MPKATTKKSTKSSRKNENGRSNTSLAAIGTFVMGGLLLATFRSGNINQELASVMKLDNSQKVLPGFVYTEYKPSPVEAYIMNHTKEMGLEAPMPGTAQTCHIWKDSESTPYFTQLQDYVVELMAYYELVGQFNLGISDLRRNLTHSSHNEVCEAVKLHPDGLPGLFPKSNQLSWSASGWVEPLLPSMRHPKFCISGRKYLLNMSYMLHDFYALCHKLKPSSRTVFIDMGASLTFHHGQQSPTMYMLDLYAKFGFKFDHIYAYEMTQADPNTVFDLIPTQYESAFHWINVGVASETESRRNPFHLILENYEEDDIVIVKLDVDTPHLEKALAEQLLSEPRLAKLIDHFYFEQHVNQAELRSAWGTRGITDSVADAMNLFYSIRKMGIPSHFWV